MRMTKNSNYKKLPHLITLVFKFLKTIPKGRVTTYGAVAKACGVPISRNVGWILKQNTDPDKIPCYRVVRSDGRLAKSYAFGGLEGQKKWLRADGIRFTPSGKIKNFSRISQK